MHDFKPIETDENIDAQGKEYMSLFFHQLRFSPHSDIVCMPTFTTTRCLFFYSLFPLYFVVLSFKNKISNVIYFGSINYYQALNVDPCFWQMMFVCLGFFVHSRIFHWYGDVTIAGKGLQFLTLYARHSWPLSSDGSLARHTYCDTGHPLIIVIF